MGESRWWGKRGRGGGAKGGAGAGSGGGARRHPTLNSARSRKLSRRGPSYYWDGRPRGDTLFCLCPFLFWVFSPSSLALDFVVPLLKPPRRRMWKSAAWVEMGEGPSATSFLSRRRRGLQRQHLCCWPGDRETHLPPPWGGMGGGVRGLSAQPRWRGGFLRPL